MYACEVDPVTLADLRQLRLGVAAGLHLEWGPNNRTAAMLLTPPGLIEPRALYFHRAMLNWKRQMVYGIGPTNGVCGYWDHARADQGRAKGPIHLVLKIRHPCGVIPTNPHALAVSPLRTS